MSDKPGMSSPEIEALPVKKKAAHPKVSEMVNVAITTLAERKGSSLRAINKYISANYDIDVKKQSVYIKKYLKSAVERGELVQTTGKGATGSFKMSKTKAAVSPKVSDAKPRKKPILHTSTPKKSLKPKKAFVAHKSPVKKLNSVDGGETALDTTFTKPTKKVVKKPRVSVPTKSRKSKVSLGGKIKKPKKLIKKTDQKSKAADSQKEKASETGAEPKPAKAKSTAKSEKSKSANAKKPVASVPKKAVVKKTSQ